MENQVQLHFTLACLVWYTRGAAGQKEEWYRDLCQREVVKQEVRRNQLTLEGEEKTAAASARSS